MNAPMEKPEAGAALARAPHDLVPLALVPILAVAALPFVGSTSTWLTLTVAGLAMGMIIFITASGLTLVFGLMDVLNFGHGVFITAGAYLGAAALGHLAAGGGSGNLWTDLATVLAVVVFAMVCTAALGLVFERLLIRPVYGAHLKQILVTMGGMIIGEELIKVVWGPDMVTVLPLESLRGSILIGDSAIEKFRILSVIVGLVVFATMVFILNRTKIGLLIRAGVQDREMVEALGYRIRRLFVAVFAAGAALAGLGGALWGMYQQNFTATVGAQLNVLIFIVIIIGGLGSTTGSFLGALLVGLLANYTGFLAPKVALFSNILLMVLLLLWRPSGLYPVAKR